MGWASGSDLMSDIIETLKEEVPNKKKRRRIYASFIESFKNHDWDTQEECLGQDKEFDLALIDAYPEWDWNKQDE